MSPCRPLRECRASATDMLAHVTERKPGGACLDTLLRATMISGVPPWSNPLRPSYTDACRRLTAPDRRRDLQGAATGSSDARPGPISSLNGEPLPSPTATHGARLRQATERRAWS